MNARGGSQIGNGRGLLGKSAGLAAEVLSASADPNVLGHDLASVLGKRAELREQAVGEHGVAGEVRVGHISCLVVCVCFWFRMSKKETQRDAETGRHREDGNVSM